MSTPHSLAGAFFAGLQNRLLKPAAHCRLLVFGLLFQTAALHATQTENNVLPIVPALGAVKVDGQANDWDLSGGIFACDNVEQLRDDFSVWFFGMYDQKNLYLLAKWKDRTPLNNDQSSKGGHGFAGDCLQVRFITGYKTPGERVSHWMGWRDRDGISILSTAYNRDFKGPAIDDATKEGASQAFQVDSDGLGYVQEIAIPWKLLTSDGQPPAPGDSVRMAIEPNYSSGPPWGRLNIHDIFRAGVVPDRVFTFRAYDQWGEGHLEKRGHLSIASVRLSDEREFLVQGVDEVWPKPDWTGLIQKVERPGFKAITFTTPADGDVSLNIMDSAGQVVRQLLTENHYDKGTHEVKWDGLTTPHYKTPGVPVAPGDYTWEAIIHPPFQLTLRGWADNGGNTPWNNGPTSHWGGDHGVPSAVATDGEKVYLGWSFAEAGKPLLGCDLDGHVVWKSGSGLCDSAQDLAIDDGILFSSGSLNSIPKGQLVRMRTSDGVYDNWQGRPDAAIEISQLWADKPVPAAWPKASDGIAAQKGQLYLSFSRQNFYADCFTDLKGLAQKLLGDDPLDKRIADEIDQRLIRMLKPFIAGKKTEKDLAIGRLRFEVVTAKVLTKLLDATDLAEGTAAMTPSARATANRKFLEAHFGALIAPLNTNFIAACDAKSGKVLKTFGVPSPQALRVLGDNSVAFISEGTSILSLDPATGATKTLVSGLKDAVSFTTDDTGKFYVGVAGTQQQVRVFTASGKPAGTIGRAGGRQLLGTWQADGLYAPNSITVDNKTHRLWVAESDAFPKRISVWNLSDGALVKDFYGATPYGAPGGAINPLDPNVMVGVGCEWLLDPATGQAKCTGIFDRVEHGYAAFCPGTNGRLYLSVNFEVAHNLCGVRIFERTSEGVYKMRAEWRPDYGAQTTAVWSDINGDGKKDPDEITTLPYTVRLHGNPGWSQNINPADMSLYGALQDAMSVKRMSAATLEIPDGEVKATQTDFKKVYRYKPAGFTACGAPKWDLAAPLDLSYAWSEALHGAGYGMRPSADNRLLVTVEANDFRCYDLTTSKQLWSYPNTFYHVHGSHLAPPPISGLTRGAFGLVGIFKTPQLGTVWALNGNCGEWYLLTEKGYYLGRLFQGDVMKMHYPELAVPGADMTNAPSGSGGEDFGGSLTQTPDGTVYIEAGKTALWNLLATGFDKVAVTGKGKVVIDTKDVELARLQQEAQLQTAAGTKFASVKHLTPTFTGMPRKDFAGVTALSYDKGATSAVQTTLASDEQALYLAWDVTDNTPWINGATEPAQLYLGGDTVDFQFGSDSKASSKRTEAVAGDFRLSIGNFRGKPTAMLYRNVSKVKQPMAFSSGVIAHYPMDYVGQVADARITVTIRPDKKGYIVEAAIPWTALDFTPQADLKYRGDTGVTYGDESGTRTRLRVYWSNQETGLVDDAVFEIKMLPRNWGDIVFPK